jgi:hypothetical protein
MKLLRFVVTAYFVLTIPTLSIATGQMPTMDTGMDRGYNQAPPMMQNPQMNYEMMMQKRQQMMQMQQQNRPMNNASGMNHNPSMCNHSPKKNRMKMKMKANKMEHMKKMEARLANIEGLLKELVELQKSK